MLQKNVVAQKNIGEMLRECRMSAKLKQHELAYRLNVDRSVISRVETGEMTPSYVLVKDWARVTGGQEMIGLDISGGKDGWKKLRTLETVVKQVKSTMDLVNFMKRKRA